MDPTDIDRQLTGLAGLGDPIRRALYGYVADRGVPVSRDDAAHAAGISRPLAAYHLDKLVDDGLLEPRYQRRSGRRGPGAGRPAKHYIRADRPFELSLPARDYAALAELLAGAPSRPTPPAPPRPPFTAPPPPSARRSAPRQPPAPSPTANQALAAVRQALAARGYEPYDDPDGTIRLRNCPFDRIATRHRELVCGANHAMLQALTDRLAGDPPTVRAVLDPQPGRCCVTLTRDT